MTKAQELQLRSSEIRERLNVLQTQETRTDEEVTEVGTLSKELTDVETRWRAAIIADQATPDKQDLDDTEGAEFRGLVERANAGEIFDAVLEKRSIDGATKELQDELGLNANQIPLAMLQTRAVTPAPANVGQNQQAIIPSVFPDSCAAFIGVDMPSVGTGEQVYPVLTTNATAHTPDESADAAETTGAFAADVLSPSRIQASFFYSREDRARFAGMDAALRMNLSDALGDKLDQVILAGDDEGLLRGTNLANHNVNAVTSYANYISNFAYGRVDGKWASDVSEIRVVVGSATYGHAASLYRGNNADQHALARLMADTGGVKVSAHVPAVASNKQNALIRRGMRRDMVAPVWEGVTIIPDEVTKAKSGEIVITAVMLYAAKILRSGGFYKQETQHA